MYCCECSVFCMCTYTTLCFSAIFVMLNMQANQLHIIIIIYIFMIRKLIGSTQKQQIAWAVSYQSCSVALYMHVYYIIPQSLIQGMRSRSAWLILCVLLYNILQEGQEGGCTLKVFIYSLRCRFCQGDLK